jgi:FMN-dependent NADH-azoreductase
VPPELRTPAQAGSWALTEELVNEIREADTILLGLPLYNFGAPSSVKTWVDHLIAPGLSHDPETKAPLLGGREFVVLASRGGGYTEGTPRHGWDHAEPWLPHAISLTGLEPRFITAELTLAHTNPAMAELIPLADQSLAEAERAIDALWTPESAVADLACPLADPLTDTPIPRHERELRAAFRPDPTNPQHQPADLGDQ